MEVNKIYEGKCLDVIATFPDKSIDCVITSPPYWQLRDYGWSGQWGMEKTFQEYLEHLWQLMDEVYRVLKDTGTVWINLGDTYMGGISGQGGDCGKHTIENAEIKGTRFEGGKKEGLPSKCLCLIPHRFAIGCIDRGWVMRNDVVWAKRNGMPESVTDRFSKKHEYFFFMVKSEKYYFDLDGIRGKYLTNENGPDAIVRNRLYDYDSKLNKMNKKSYGKTTVFGGKKGNGQDTEGTYSGNEWFPNEKGKNPGSISDFWDIPTKGNNDEHFASYNTKLIDKPIMAGCPKGGIILDPFAGTCTTGVRTVNLQRKFIGIEGKKEYCKIGNNKLNSEIIKLQLF